MTHCPSCGKRVGKTAAFCASCGHPLGDEAPAAAPTPAPAPATTDAAPGPGVPRWMSTDWPLAVLCVLLFVALAAGAGAVIGLAGTMVADGPSVNGLIGLVAGAWAPFAGLGDDAFVAVSSEDTLAAWFTSGISPTVAIGLAGLAWLLYRAALPRVAVARGFTVAFVAKVAVLGAVAVGVLGTAGSIGDIDEPSGSNFQVFASVGSAEPAIWTFVILGVVGLFAARDRLGRVAWLERQSWLRPLQAGMAAWLVVVLALGLGVSVAGIVAGDDASEGFAGAIVAPVVLGNTGTAAQAFAVGASVEVVSDPSDFEPFDRSVDEHLSLVHFDIPPDEDSDAAPLWLWPIVLVSPLVLFAAARRWLARAKPADGGSVLLQTTGIAAGFGLAAWLGATLAPLYSGAVAVTLSTDAFDPVGRAVVARPAVGATVGLSLLWAFVGALPAAVRYARRNGIDLIASSSSGTPTPTEPAA